MSIICTCIFTIKCYCTTVKINHGRPFWQLSVVGHGRTRSHMVGHGRTRLNTVAQIKMSLEISDGLCARTRSHTVGQNL